MQNGFIERVISAGTGPERYTLSVPYFVLPGALQFDTALLTEPLEAHLAVAVRHEARNGYQRLVLGPFAGEDAARAAFAIVWASLARLTVVHQFSIRFDHSIAPLRRTPKLITWDDRPIHGIACLILPQIIPEHETIFDDDVAMGTRPAQLIPARVAETFAPPLYPKPQDARLELAFDAYAAAFATHTHALRFLGLTGMLEILMEEERRPLEEQAQLEQMAAMIRTAPAFKTSEALRGLADNAAQAVLQRKTLSKTVALGALLERHRGRIEAALGLGQTIADLQRLAHDIYTTRSTITHAGTMKNDEATRATERSLLAVAEAVLLDWLDGRGSPPAPPGAS